MNYKEQLKVNYRNNKQKLWVKTYTNALTDDVHPSVASEQARKAVDSFVKRFPDYCAD